MAVHIQIDDLGTSISYSIGGTAQSVFAIPFGFFENTDIVATLSGQVLTLDVDYSLTGAGVTGAGVLTLDTAVTDATLVIERVLPIARTTDFPDSGPFSIPALNTQLDKLVAICQQIDAGTTGTGQSLLAQVILARDAALAAAAALGGNIVTGYAVTPEMFGADGTAANDTAGIQAAIDSGVGAIRYEPRTYLLKRPGIVLASNQQHVGVAGKTVWQASEQMGVGLTSDMVFASGKSNFGLYEITFDGNGFLTGAASWDSGGTEGDGNFYFTHPISRFPGTLPCVHISECSHFTVWRCKFIGYDTSALLVNVVSDFTIAYNEITRTGQERLYPNYGISFSGSNAAAPCTRGAFIFNTLVNGGMGGASSHSLFAWNRISGWAMGPGINQAGVNWAGNNRIIFNDIGPSNQAYDLDSYAPGGLELFSPDSTIVGNILHECFGPGIYNFGPNCTIADNVIYDNGGISGDPTGNSGIYVLRSVIGTGESVGSDYCAITGNRCFDTRVGAAKTQGYGYQEQAGGAFVGIKMSNNLFTGNRFGDAIYDGNDTENPDRPWRAFSTMAITASSGAFAVGGITGSLYYNVVGSRLDFVFTSTTGAAGVGTATGVLKFTIPYNAAREQACFGFNRSDGTSCNGRAASSASNIIEVRKYDATFPAGNNAVLVVSGSIEVTR